MGQFRISVLAFTTLALFGAGQMYAQQASAFDRQLPPGIRQYLEKIMPPPEISLPLYGKGAIPNAIPCSNQEKLTGRVDVDKSTRFFEALRHEGVPVDMTIFRKGEHPFVLLPRDQWLSIVIHWIEANNWLYEKAN